jgi:hypothetical protein
VKSLEILEPGDYCAFVIDLGNYQRNNFTPKLIFEELRKATSGGFTFSQYHWRRSGNFLLQVRSATSKEIVEAAISKAINEVSAGGSNHLFGSIIRSLNTLQALVDYATKETGLKLGRSDVLKAGKSVKITAAFVDPTDTLQVSWPRSISKRVEILDSLEEDAGTLLALYLRPQVGGDIGEVAKAVKAFFRRNGIVAHSTARSITVIDDVVTGRLKS